MTLQRNPDGSASYVPPSGANAASDVYQLSRPSQIPATEGQLGGARYSVSAVGKEHPGLYHWTLQIYDARGGLNLQGPTTFLRAHNRAASSNLDHSYEEMAILPAITTTQTSPSVGTFHPIHSSLNIFGQFAYAIGDTTVYRETSATDPTIISTTHPAGVDNVIGLESIVIGGATVAPRCAVLRLTGAIQVISDLATPPTIDGTMHANTAACYGIITTPYNDNTMLLYAGGALRTLKATDALGTAPTTVLTSVPSGGHALGLASFAGGPVRAVWNWPYATAVNQLSYGYYNEYSTPSNVIANFNTYQRSRIVTTNVQGTDASTLKLPLATVVHDSLFRDGLVATDLKTVIFYNGRVTRDLHIFRDRGQTSGLSYYCTGFWVYGQTLFAWITLADTANTIVSKTWLEQYNFDLDVWTPASAARTLSYAGLYSGGSPTNRPLSVNSDMAHAYQDGKWQYTRIHNGSINPFSYRKTSGGATGSGQEYEATGTLTLPEFDIPGLEGSPKLVTNVMGPPTKNITAGGTNAFIIVTVGGQSWGFNDAEPSGRYAQGFRGANNNWVQTLQPSIFISRATTGTDSTRYTPNALPITIEGYAVKKETSPIPPNWKNARR